jgi:hypothetical protein
MWLHSFTRAQADADGYLTRYHQLARASLFGSSIVDQPTTRAVQALVCNCLPDPPRFPLTAKQYLMVFYQFLEDPYTSTSNARWATMGCVFSRFANVPVMLNLKRDPGWLSNWLKA